MSKALEGKTVLVTGASRGIGAAAAVALARAGAGRVLIHYGSYEEGARKTLEAIRAAGAEAASVQADLSTEAGIRHLMERIRGGEFAADVLVNNAGSLVRRARLQEFTPDLFDTVFRLNVKSLWFITQAAVPHMKAQGQGVIVNVSSVAARNGGGPGATVYAAAKAAVNAITKGLAKELAPHGIRVNAVSPGAVDNHFHEQFTPREVLERMAASTVAGRLGTNEDIADVIVFLCSEQARYIYGQTIEVNGGALMV